MIKRQTTLFDGDSAPMDEENNRQKIEELKAGFMDFADRMNHAKEDDMMSIEQSIQFSSSSASHDRIDIPAIDADIDRPTEVGLLGALTHGLFDNFRLDDDVLNELKESRHFAKISDRSIGRGNAKESDYIFNQLPESKNTVELLLKKVSHHFLSHSTHH